MLIGLIVGGGISEASYFIRTPMDEWSVTGALTATAKGAAMGAFGATSIGGAYFAVQGALEAIKIWRNPNSTPLQKALASGMMLISFASAYLLRTQVRSQFLEWKNVYSNIPLCLQVQTDLAAIRAAQVAGEDSVTIGTQTILFGDSTRVAGTVIGGEIVLMPGAFASGDEYLMKTILEENLHLYRMQTGTTLAGNELFAGMGGMIEGEEQTVKALVDDIYDVGVGREWW